MSEKILFVDDEPKILDGIQRQLFGEFDLETAVGADAALERLASGGPFAVVVSDMRMPGMDGVQFLATIRQRAPDSVRMMLTGCADQDTAIQAVNEGCIFRFLTKPCAPEHLVNALTDGIEQYRLIRAEKDLLQKTLRGAVKVLSEVLALTNPTAFGYASRVQRLVRALCVEMKIDKSWQLEIAAMLSQIGCVTVPPDTLERAWRGKPLKRVEMEMITSYPSRGSELVRNIPRLDEIARIIAYQQKCFDGSGFPDDPIVGNEIPLGARILKVCLDYELLIGSGDPAPVAVRKLREKHHRYDPAALHALEKVVPAEQTCVVEERTLSDVPMHAVLAEDVILPDGMFVVGKGQEITPSLCERLNNFARSRKCEGQIRLRVLVQKRIEKVAAS